MSSTINEVIGSDRSADLNTLMIAMAIAASSHAGQVDKAGEPKLCHVLRVGNSLLPDVEAAIVGVLHDVLEDTETPMSELIDELGLNEAQVNALALLTRTESEPYEKYIRAIATAGSSGATIARKVKLADLRDNMDPRRQALAEARVGPVFMVERRVRYWQAIAMLNGGPRYLRTDCG